MNDPETEAELVAYATYKQTEREIKEALALLESYWLERPHLRLGQIIVNAFRCTSNYRRNPEPEFSDLFYVPDSVLLAELETLANLSNEPQSTNPTQK
jgi:hypothetical protein